MTMKAFRVLIAFSFLALLYLQPSSVPSKFTAIPERMQAFVDDGSVSVAVTLVAGKGEMVGLEAVGLAEIANKKPMRPDSLFWIGWMANPVTATAIMILQDDGNLSVDDP